MITFSSPAYAHCIGTAQSSIAKVHQCGCELPPSTNHVARTYFSHTSLPLIGCGRLVTIACIPVRQSRPLPLPPNRRSPFAVVINIFRILHNIILEYAEAHFWFPVQNQLITIVLSDNEANWGRGRGDFTIFSVIYGRLITAHAQKQLPVGFRLKL